MEKELTHKEKMLYKTRITRRSRLFRYILVLALFTAGLSSYYLSIDIPYLPYASMVLLGLGFVMLAITETLLFTHRLYVTDQAVTERIGLLSRRVKTVDLEDITDIVVTQGVWQRMLNYGELHVNTPEDKKYEEIVFPLLAKPMAIKRLIEEIMRKRTYFPSERDKHHTIRHHPDRERKSHDIHKEHE